MGRRGQVKIRPGVQDARLDPADVHGVQPNQPHAEIRPRRFNVRPKRGGVMVGFGVEFPSKFVGVAGARNDHLLPAELHAGDGEIAERGRHPVIRRRLKNLQRVRPLHLTDENVRVGDFHVHPGAMRPRPGIEIPVRLRIPEPVLRQTQHNPVGDHAAVFIAGEAIAAAPDLQPGHVLGEEPVQQPFGVWPGEFQRIFAGVQHPGSAPQAPVFFRCVALVETNRHQPSVVDAIMRAEGAFDLVIGVAGD